MSHERPVEPALVQRVEEVQGELRASRKALGPMPQENARLRAQLETLQSGAEELRRELEALRQGLPVNAPQLPQTLSPPFEATVQRSMRRPLLDLGFMAVCVGLILLRAGLGAWPWAAAAAGVLAAFWLLNVLAAPRWRFEATQAKPLGLSWREQRNVVSYRAIRDVQVLVTPSQKRRGVGTVVVRYSGMQGEMSALIRNVPEPERLAEWLRSKQDGPPQRP